jgi:AbrB family looped-hinge helix DNA binding protein
MVTAVVGRDGRITIPREVRAATRLGEGDELEVEVTSQGILLRPVHAPDLDLSQFETPEGMARVRDAINAVRSGEPWIFESGEEFVAVLEQLSADDHADV